jgi:Spy/CpxP family protein refolding chaperone
MKKVILLATCLFAASTTISAQEAAVKTKTEAAPNQKNEVRMTPEQQAQKNVDKLNAEVGLTEDQKTKIHALALNRVTKANEIRHKYKGQPENKETAHKEIDILRKEYRKEVTALLTPEQLEKIKVKNKGMKAANDGKPADSNVIDAND